MDLPRIAVIGCGYWGKNLVRNFYQLGCLVLVCDQNEENFKKIRKDYPVSFTKDLKDVLNDPNIDAVVISTPAKMHYEHTKKAILANKDVFVEKPLALDLSEAEELCNLAERKNKILMVGHLLQYHPAFLRIKEMVAKGLLGRINYIYSHRLNFGKIRREEDILWSFAPHDISMILSLAGEDPTEVLAIGAYYLHPQIADVTTTHLSFPSGIRAHIFVSWLHPFKEQKLVIVAEDSMLVFNDTQPWEKKLLLYPHDIKWINGIPVPQKAEPQKIRLEEKEPLKEECQHFINSIVTRQKPRTDGWEGYRVLSVLTAAKNSLLQKERVVFSEKEKNYFVHETAIIDNNVIIGSGTKIWHFSHILSGSRIGKNCIIGQNCMIGPDVTVGDNCKIQNNVSIYKGVELEDDVFCGPSCVFTNVLTPRAFIERKSSFQKTLVKKGATIGANSTIICGHTIGRYALIGAGAVVTSDVPDYALFLGVPARHAGWVCKCGIVLTRETEISENSLFKCPECKREYKFSEGKLHPLGD